MRNAPRTYLQFECYLVGALLVQRIKFRDHPIQRYPFPLARPCMVKPVHFQSHWKIYQFCFAMDVRRNVPRKSEFLDPPRVSALNNRIPYQITIDVRIFDTPPLSPPGRPNVPLDITNFEISTSLKKNLLPFHQDSMPSTRRSTCASIPRNRVVLRHFECFFCVKLSEKKKQFQNSNLTNVLTFL